MANAKGYIDEKQEWANSGTKIAPSGAKVDTGWIPNEQPPAEWENSERFEVEQRLNVLIRRDGIAGTKPGNIKGAQLADRLFYGVKGWHNPTADSNSHSYGSIVDAVVCWDYERNAPMLVFFSQADAAAHVLKKIGAWSYDGALSGKIENLSINPSITIAAGSKNRVCADKDFLYLHCLDSVGGNTWVLKFALNPWTGTPVDEYDLGSVLEYDEIIVVNDSSLAMIRSGTGSNRLAVLDKAFTTLIQGNGNFNATWDIYIPGRIVSDGSRIFFVGNDSGTDWYLCAANISNLGAPSTPSAAIFLAGLEDVSGLISLGEDVIFYGYGTNIDYLWRYNRTHDDLNALHRITGMCRISGHARTSLIFDGQNITAIFNVHSDFMNSATDNGIGFLKFPALEFQGRLKGAATAPFIVDNRIPQLTGVIYPSDPGGLFVKPLFDGNDLWLIHNSIGFISRVNAIAQR